MSKVVNMANGRRKVRRPFALVSNYDFCPPGPMGAPHLPRPAIPDAHSNDIMVPRRLSQQSDTMGLLGKVKSDKFRLNPGKL